MSKDIENWRGYEWTALSVTTIGTLLASIQGSALLLHCRISLTQLRRGFMTIMWVLLGFMLITTAFVPVVGRLADIWQKEALQRRICHIHTGLRFSPGSQIRSFTDGIWWPA